MIKKTHFLKFYLAPVLCYNSTVRQAESRLFWGLSMEPGLWAVEFSSTHSTVAHLRLQSSYICSPCNHLSVSEDRLYSRNKLITERELFCSWLSQRHWVGVASLGCYQEWVSEESEKESSPGQWVIEDRQSSPQGSYPDLGHYKSLLSPPLIGIFWGAHSHVKGRHLWKGTVEASGNSGHIWIRIATQNGELVLESKLLACHL